MPHCVVVDTNVLAIAGDLNPGASDECKLACIQILRRIEAGQRLGVDEADEVFNEYLSTLRACDRSNFVSKLVRTLFHLRYDNAVCHRVAITPTDPPPGSYAEVPVELRDFDADDQKFIAVAAAEGATPPLFAGLDGEWWRRRPDFARAGIDLQFPCAADLI